MGLDQPCGSCGQPIYFNYEGPFEGVCGRCTDRMVAKHSGRGKRRTPVIPGSESRGTSSLAWVLVFLAGAAAGILAGPYLPF